MLSDVVLWWPKVILCYMESPPGGTALNFSHITLTVIMSAMASQITVVSIVYSTVCSGAYQRKHQSFASLAFVRGIHRSPVTRKTFPFDDVIMNHSDCCYGSLGAWHAKSWQIQVVVDRVIWGNWEVFDYTRSIPQVCFRGILFSQIEIGYLILWHILC